VRLAKHRATGKRYVVKLLNLDRCAHVGAGWGQPGGGGARQLGVTDEEAQAVEAEASLLKMASCHPNVVRFHGCFRRNAGAHTEQAQLCIVMSHCEGGDLATLLKSVGHEPLPEVAIMRWLVQLLLGRGEGMLAHTPVPKSLCASQARARRSSRSLLN
jgi:serine/threonine protein kinase